MSYRHQPRYGRSTPRFSRSRGRKYQTKSFDPSVFVQKAVGTDSVNYQPQHQFADFALDPQLKQNIRSLGFPQPTAIQDQAIPAILQGRDVVGIANTGTGKTATFLIPLVQKVTQASNTKVLIISPTRELTNQTAAELRNYTAYLPIYSTICIGGVPIFRQIQNLKKNPHFVIGTPGRLKDLERHYHLNFKSFNTIVLDEVDQMLDMGFIHDMTDIISKLAPNRQSLFFSATLSPQAQTVMHRFLTDPVIVTTKTSDSLANIDQDIIKVGQRSKNEVLHELLITRGFTKVLVFGRTKHGLNQLEKNLKNRGHKVAAIHGNKSQNQRQRVLNAFRENHLQALLATDVASRGLDIDNVTHVINYDLPQTYEDYIHRIGRTGRATKSGVALTFID